jgi:hypothetical protein
VVQAMIRPGDVYIRAAARMWFSRNQTAPSATARPTLEWARVAVAAEDRMRDMGSDDDEVEAWFAGLWARDGVEDPAAVDSS